MRHREARHDAPHGPFESRVAARAAHGLPMESREHAIADLDLPIAAHEVAVEPRDVPVRDDVASYGPVHTAAVPPSPPTRLCLARQPPALCGYVFSSFGKCAISGACSRYSTLLGAPNVMTPFCGSETMSEPPR
jgi:hypothetical protein